MPKYWGKQIFSLGRFPEVGQKQKTKVFNNNGQLRIDIPPRVAHAKPPGPKKLQNILSSPSIAFHPLWDARNLIFSLKPYLNPANG